jgi:hypothetical protein
LCLEVLHRQLAVLNHLGKSSPARKEVHRPLLYQFLLSQRLCLEALHRQLDRPLLYLFLLLLHWCPEALRRQLDRWLLYLFLPLLHSFPEGLRHRLALLRPLCHYFLRP